MRLRSRSAVPAASALLLALLGGLLAVAGVSTAPAGAAPAAQQAAASPRASASDGFYRYHGTKPLKQIKPGTVLKKRTVSYHVAGVPVPIPVTQLLYRTVNARRQPAVNVTSVLQNPLLPATSSVLSYQSFYDSLNPDDEPSVAIAGGLSVGGGIAYAETGIIAPALLAGTTVVITDTQGQTADFAAGPEYGYTTLDALRAVTRSGFGLGTTPRIALLGYSGGAIATEWAAELAPRYAPGVNKLLVGSAFGGVLVEPDHNLHYIEGSQIWAGVAAMALVGVGRAYDVNLLPYANARGKKLLKSIDHASIGEVLGRYPGLTWQDVVKKKYPQPENLKVFVKLSNKLIMGRSKGTPSAPMFIGQGDGGPVEGTPAGGPGIGPGDGVMIAGDVRTLARDYCQRGVPVQYTQYHGLSHVGAAAGFLPAAYEWVLGRLSDPTSPAPTSCGTIPKGNHVGPVKYRPAHRS